MKLYFRWAAERRPGALWVEYYHRSWAAYRAWFLKEGDDARPDLDECRRKLGEFMPELIPTWERLADLTEGDETAARMLALWCPAPFIGACTQAVWLDGEPFLVRNYDFHPHACEGNFLLSSWHGREVLASNDCLWGALDGMNQAGLVAALSFGGRKVRGDGFGIPLVLRYILEFSETTAEAIKVLGRVPSHMAYNVTLLDRQGRHAVVEVAPDRDAVVHRRRISANRQEGRLWQAYQRFSRSRERERHLRALLRRRGLTADELIEAFLETPLFTRDYARGSGTLYTVVYRPTRATAEYLWKGGRTEQSMEDFETRFLEVPLR